MFRPILSGLRLLLLLAVLQAGLSAQTGTIVSGIVTDQSGAVVVGAIVSARNPSNGQILATTQTDLSGKYELRGLNFGAYRIEVHQAGFAVAEKTVQLQTSTVSDANFLLVPAGIENTVTVTAGRGNERLISETPQAVTVIGAPEIETRRPVAIMQSLDDVPNLITVGANPLAARPRLRGLTSNRLLVLIDGERLNNVRTDLLSGISPAVVDVLQLESAEVLAGAGSSLYGSDSIAGTINLVSKDIARPAHGKYLSLRFDADARSNGFFRRGATTLNLSGARAALQISGSLFGLDSYHAGGKAISLDEVVRIGRFANELGNATNNNLARTFAVWQLPADGEVLNGQGHGFYSQLDLRLFPSPKHSLRYHQLGNQHKDIGFSFIVPPFDLREQSNSFRRLDKYGLRYEGHEIRSWLLRASLSAYFQKYSFSDTNVTSSIDLGSSWTLIPGANPAAPAIPGLTGNPSTFTPANFTDGKNTTTSFGMEAQATFSIRDKARLTTSLGYLRDSSIDQFSRFDFSPTTRQSQNFISGRATTPDSVYRNLNWSNLVEYDPLGWLHFSGGLRIDNWRTEAKVTSGFPLTTEATIVEASFNNLRATPGAIDIGGAAGVLDLLDGRANITTNRTSMTGNLGVVFRLPGGINPYFRWATSYREPGVTERYILRNFGDPTFSVVLIPNTILKPERGANYEGGLKIRRENWGVAFGYFRNNLRDFIRSEFAPALFVPANPARGLNSLSPFFPFHGVLYVQRANTARARIQGFEATYNARISLGAAGSLQPFGTLGWLKGSNFTPDANTLTIIRQFYNRADTPVRLRGSEQDAPLPGISPFGNSFGLRYSSSGGWSGEYNVQYRAPVTRVDPADLATTISTQYGSFASLRAYVNQSARVGYTLRREAYRSSFIFGVENLTNRLYFEPFQTAPAPGRSFVFGVNFELLDLLRR